MKDEDKKKPEPEPTPEPEPEPEPTPEPTPEPEPEPDYAEAIAEVKRGYEEKIIALEKDAKEKIAKRDAVIKQLLINGKGEDNPQTIAEQINIKRKSLLRKW